MEIPAIALARFVERRIARIRHHRSLLGQTSAGFIAVRAVRQCTVDEQYKYPTGARIAMNDLYYDDLLSGTDTEVEIRHAYHQVSQLLRSSGFELAKWATNSTVLKDELHAEFKIPMDCGVLGMRWCPRSDSLQLKAANHIEIADEHLTDRDRQNSPARHLA